MLCTRYSGGISQLQLKPGRIHLLPKILSSAGKQGQKTGITSGLDKQSFFHWSDSQEKHDDGFDTRVLSVHHETTTKRRMMQSLFKQSPKIQRERTGSLMQNPEIVQGSAWASLFKDYWGFCGQPQSVSSEVRTVPCCWEE